MSRQCSVTELIDQSYALGRAGQIGAAFQRAQEALTVARADGEPDAIAAALLCLAMVQFRLGHYADALQLGEEALTHTSTAAPRHVEALLMLGMCATETSDLDAGEDFYRRALDLSRQFDHVSLLQRSLVNLAAGVYIPRGQFDLALAADEEALRLALERNLPAAVQLPFIGITWASLLTGQRERARAALKRLGQVVAPGSTSQGHYYSFSADLCRDEGDIETALELYSRVRAIAETTGDPGMSVWYRLGVSRCHHLRGNASTARMWANDALTIASRVGYCHFQGLALVERGRAAWETGDTSAAEADLRAAIEILDRLGAAFDLARAQLVLAALVHRERRGETRSIFKQAAHGILSGGYAFLLEQERTLVFPLVAAYLNDSDGALAGDCAALVGQLERVPPPPLRVITLGGLEIRQGARPIDRPRLRRRRASELFALLLLSPAHMRSFDQLVEALWHDKEPEAAQVAFHHATATLRHALEPDLPDKFPSRYLEVEEGRVTLHLPPGSSVDFETFEAHCRKREWEAALALYTGELLPEYPYAEWTIAPRQRLAQLYLDALVGLAEDKLAAGLDDAALDACTRVLELEPWQERAALLGMRACLRLNDRARARRLYRNLEKSLREDLNTEPQPELQTLYRSLTPTARTKSPTR